MARSRSAVIPADAELERAARRLAHAFVVAHDSTGRDYVDAMLDLDGATHDLIVAAGETCPYCEPGTCPGPILELSHGARELELSHDVGLLVRPIEETPPL